ncbi:MAG: 2-oxo acid dehydrogenase subunit E2 [Synergistaceae bacterium]|jgi:pyruvate dehydrogenase E2 component (dihydrolipoamide acetyltransferase)|nr:2-oxo acid dehydrogenase subunit E2 [Synergistaceae bacterium]
MAQIVVMPKVGISVESCVISVWKKRVGDLVKTGDILFDYETDKASLECESTADGTILEIFSGDGDEVPVLSPVCVIGEPDEDISSLCPGGLTAAAKEPGPAETHAPRAAHAEVPAACPGGTKISPRARNLAVRRGLDASLAEPTGPHGRIIARDVEALERGIFESGEAPQAEIAAAPKTAAAGCTDEKMPMIRRAIANAMTSSLRNTAQLTNHHSFDAAQILELRSRFKAEGAKLGLDGISIGDMVLFATVKTLLEYPYMNAHLLEGDVIRRFSGVNLGVAVDTPRGLIVPTIMDAGGMTLSQISGAVRELAEAARAGNISPDLLQGATFTVSNLGATGVEMFTPIINPPQVGILGVCGITARPRAEGGALKSYPAMGLSVTYDHRAVDGAPASRFAQALCEKLERFQTLLAFDAA